MSLADDKEDKDDEIKALVYSGADLMKIYSEVDKKLD